MAVPLIVMHWLILLLIIAAYVMGTILEDMALSPAKLRLYAWHKWVGMLVLFLVPLRIGCALPKTGSSSGPDALRGPRLRHRPRPAVSVADRRAHAGVAA
jgi:cytochrome b561